MTEKLSDRMKKSIALLSELIDDKSPLASIDAEARSKVYAKTLPDVEALEAENERLKAKLSSIQQAAAPIVYSVKIAEEDEHDVEGALLLEQVRRLDGQTYTVGVYCQSGQLKSRHLQALVKALEGE